MESKEMDGGWAEGTAGAKALRWAGGVKGH